MTICEELTSNDGHHWTLLSEHQESFAAFPFRNIQVFFLYPSEQGDSLGKNPISL